MSDHAAVRLPRRAGRRSASRARRAHAAGGGGHPNLDGLAQRGRTGSVVTVGPGIAPESDIGVFGILGYDPSEEHPGRGVLEAMGIGMDFDDGDLAYRINFATCEMAGDRGPAGRARPDVRRGARPGRRGRSGAHPSRCDVRAPGDDRAPRGTGDPRRDGPLSANVTNTDPAYRQRGPARGRAGDVRPGGRDGHRARRLRRAHGTPPTSRTHSSRAPPGSWTPRP